ncbi:hypothetical protein VPH35_031729 [Triticum aestivum]
MADEKGSLVTGSMTSGESTTKHALAAGEERPLKRCRHASTEKHPLKPCTAKRKAEADDEELRAAKRKAFYMKSGPSKKMTRQPRADVASILSSRTHPDRAPSFFKALKLQNPDLIPSLEHPRGRIWFSYLPFAILLIAFHQCPKIIYAARCVVMSTLRTGGAGANDAVGRPNC